MKKFSILVLCAITYFVISPNKAKAQVVIWPTNDTDWTSLNLQDPSGDQNPARVDIVGNATHSAGFYSIGANAGGDVNLMMRMRIRAASGSQNNVWQFLLNTDGDPTTIQWVLQIDTNSDDEVELRQTTVGGNTFGAIALATGSAWTGSLADYSRTNLTPQIGGGEESTIGGANNVFFDAVIPWIALANIFGVDPEKGISIGITVGTSTNHNNNNKDYIGNGNIIDSGTNNPILIPEPTAALIIGLVFIGNCLPRRANKKPRIFK